MHYDVDHKSTDPWFTPASVAVVGASTRPGNAGASYVRALRNAGFLGSLSVVHPSGEPVQGVPCAPTATALAEPPELGIVAVPAHRVLDAVRDLARAGCRAVHVFSGGFAELPEGARDQEALAKLASENGVRLLGPNCMGIHRPASRLTFRSDLPMLPGPVGIVAQSGGVAINLIQMLAARGIGVSAAVSFGNAALLGAAWWTRAVASLPDTDTVILHAESVGEDLTRALDRPCGKPTIALRPRGTHGWHDAARRHTGAPGGSGVPASQVQGVHDLDHAVDGAELVSGAPASSTTGRRAAFVTISGGVGVLAAGEFAATGQPLTPIPEDVRHELESYDGTRLVAAQNPVDLGPRFLSRRLLSDVVSRLLTSQVVDAVVVHVPWDSVREIDAGRPGYADDFLRSVSTFTRWGEIVAYFPSLGLDGESDAQQMLRHAGIPVSASLTAIAQTFNQTRRWP